MLSLQFDPAARDQCVFETPDGRRIVFTVYQDLRSNGTPKKKVRIAFDADLGVKILRGEVWRAVHPGEEPRSRGPREPAPMAGS